MKISSAEGERPLANLHLSGQTVSGEDILIPENSKHPFSEGALELL